MPCCLALRFDRTSLLFLAQDFLLRLATATLLLFANFKILLLDLRLLPEHLFFNFENEELPCPDSVFTLLTMVLIPHVDSRWYMMELHTRRGFIDLLPAMPAPAHEMLLYLQRIHL